LLGYSVGGHIVLRAATDLVDARLSAVAAICPPLDLAAATKAFDHPVRRFYRRHIFHRLNKAYRATAARGRALVEPEIVEKARTCSERDSLTVVPRYGFSSSQDYYERESVAHRFERLSIPSLIVASLHDPIVPAETMVSVGRASSALSVAWTEDGGHVYFPRRMDLGQSGAAGLEPQVIQWLSQQ
jgi:predicted alpha/beta-fold hydrolase